MVLNQNNKSMFERKFVMKNIEKFAISDAALEQVSGGFELKSSQVKKALAYTGIILGGGLVFTSAGFVGGTVLGETLKPISRIRKKIEERKKSKEQNQGSQTPSTEEATKAVANAEPAPAVSTK